MIAHDCIVRPMRRFRTNGIGCGRTLCAAAAQHKHSAHNALPAPARAAKANASPTVHFGNGTCGCDSQR